MGVDWGKPYAVNEVSPGELSCCLKAAQTQKENFTSHLDLTSQQHVPQHWIWSNSL
jgi:hypothetical protein